MRPTVMSSNTASRLASGIDIVTTGVKYSKRALTLRKFKKLTEGLKCPIDATEVLREAIVPKSVPVVLTAPPKKCALCSPETSRWTMDLLLPKQEFDYDDHTARLELEWVMQMRKNFGGTGLMSAVETRRRSGLSVDDALKFSLAGPFTAEEISTWSDNIAAEYKALCEEA